MLKDWIAVGLGGMLGSLIRYSIMQLFMLIGPAWLPWATLTANVSGCFAMGFASQWAFDRNFVNEWWAIGVRVGLLGGLTTFSSFGMEVFGAWQSGRGGFSLGLIALHCTLGLAAITLGVWLARQT